jgi:hypothetical protein
LSGRRRDLFANRRAVCLIPKPSRGGDQEVFELANHILNYIVMYNEPHVKPFVPDLAWANKGL